MTGTTVPPNKAVVGANAFAHESGIHQHGVLADSSTYEIMSPETVGLPGNLLVLGKHSGRHAFDARVRELGYSPAPAELETIFERFKELADKKKTVSSLDIEALIHNGLAAHLRTSTSSSATASRAATPSPRRPA